MEYCEDVEVISSTRIHARISDEQPQKMDLTPWELRFLRLGYIQAGLVFDNPKYDDVAFDMIQHLQHSLSLTLDFFYPLCGRLTFDENLDDNTCCVSILCNNAGALFVHAIAEHTTVSDILDPIFVPPIVNHLFQLNDVSNDQGTSNPLLAVQVTELVDGVFIACSMNHSVADGMSFWHFFNSWAQVSRGLELKTVVSNPPVLKHWFPSDVGRPIRFPNYEKQDCGGDELIYSQASPQRVFHFSKEKIGELKAKANAEAVKDKRITISSLQALLSHIWRCVIRLQEVDPEEEVICVMFIDSRGRIVEEGPLGRNYFGNAIAGEGVRMKARDLVEGGVGKAALQFNNMIALYTQEETLKGYYKAWIKHPVINLPSTSIGTTIVVGHSPRFNVYGNDFGWGPPLALRCLPGLLANRSLNLFAGAQEGSIDLHLCLPFEILHALATDSQFMHAVSL